ncbi:hypothetical protein QBC46DRAFT_440049 [Diplogelasinospora grovesii]|uniref:Uncharacterized protein n=1 Tax=Diplogelasinospora grovesii TaxID=303347 RepID=A0AAN6N4V8_9PEZI|nr:hypothetical protein QBC46DRAFT_440049 [Diplogelasinospora grovesii]
MADPATTVPAIADGVITSSLVHSQTSITSDHNVSPDRLSHLSWNEILHVDHGLKVLYPPPAKIPGGRGYGIDLVAIHGLQGDREWSWTSRVTKFNWLTESIPKRFPGIRVLTYGYSDMTENASEELNASLVQNRTESSQV